MPKEVGGVGFDLCISSSIKQVSSFVGVGKRKNELVQSQVCVNIPNATLPHTSEKQSNTSTFVNFVDMFHTCYTKMNVSTYTVQ